MTQRALFYIALGAVLGAALLGSLTSWRAAALSVALETLQSEHAALLARHRIAVESVSAPLSDSSTTGKHVVTAEGAAEVAGDTQHHEAATTPVQGQTAFLWPAPLQLIPLATNPESRQAALAPFELCSQLVTAALEGLTHLEAEAEQKFAAGILGRTDLHRAYAHWQKDRHSTTNFSSTSATSSRPQAVKVLEDWAARLGGHYLASVAGLELQGGPSEAVKVVVWAEVLGATEMLLPDSDSGALVSGAFWARKTEDIRRWVFEDPRGINAPFGRRYEVDAGQGTLVLFPPWLSMYVEPGTTHGHTPSTATDDVLWRFLLWPPMPLKEWSWVDDPSGSIINRQPLFFDDLQ